MIRIQCPSCNASSEVSDFLKGLKVICKGCGHGILVAASQNDAALAENNAKSETAPPEIPLPPPHSKNVVRQPVHTITLTEDAVKVPPSQKVQNDESGSLPQWALDYVQASLRLDQNVLDIEKRLVERGLGAAVASEVVSEILADRIRDQSESLERDDRRQRLHFILSIVAACVCLVLAYFYDGIWASTWVLRRIALPLFCIWGHRVISAKAGRMYAILVRWCAWVLIFAIGGYVVVLLIVVLD